MFLVIFTLLFADDRRFYVLCDRCLLGDHVLLHERCHEHHVLHQDQGVLKRKWARHFPCPRSSAVSSIRVVAVLLVAIVTAFGKLVYGTPVPLDTLRRSC